MRKLSVIAKFRLHSIAYFNPNEANGLFEQSEYIFK